MSAAKFAAQQGVGQSSLHKWARRFRCPPAVAFDEVGVAGAVSTSLSEPASIEITTRNGYLLRVGAGVNAAVLRSVLSAVANC